LSLLFSAQAPENPRNLKAAAEQALLQNSDEWKYGNFKE